MKFELMPLPYSHDALAPHISNETLNYHYGKHHQTYVNNLNKLIEGTEYAEMTLEQIIQKAPAGPLFNNAAQVFNHDFFWHSLAPHAGGAPTGAIANEINQKWGSFEKFKEEFTTMATNNFGSGWTWLVKNSSGALEIVNTSNAATPITDKMKKPLLVLDIWEHAYYVDYRNLRAKYIESFWQLVNWNFANKNL